MKRIFTLLLAASALTAAVSCQKEISAPETEAPVYETMTITASTAAETKTSLGENGYSSFWSAGDQISVFDSNKGANNRCFTIVEENVEFPAKTATFSYTGEFVMPQNEQPNPTVVALYPYQENAYCDFFFSDHADITGINLPAEQTAVANGFDSDATFALALGTMATKEDLAFNNLYSLLKFTVSTPNVKKVTVTIEGEDAFIAGEAKIDLTINLANVQEGKPAFESPVLTASGSKTVTLTCEEGFATDATYYIAVAPVTYTSLAVALDEVEVKKSTTAKTLEANTVYGLGELGIPSDWIIKIGNRSITTYINGDNLVAKNVELGASDEYVLTNSSDEIRGIASTTPINKWCNLYKSEGQMKVSQKGKYDIYINRAKAAFVLVPAGAAVPQFNYSNQSLYILYENADWQGLYAWNDNGEMFGNWDACATNRQGTFKTYDGKTCSYWSIPSEYNGTAFKFIVRNSAYTVQSADTNINLDTDRGAYESKWDGQNNNAVLGIYDFKDDKGYDFAN